MSSFQDAEVARGFVEKTRAAIPYGPDQIAVMRQLVAHFRPQPALIVDLGCGDGILARTLLATCPGARAVLLDHSEPMLARARAACEAFGDRCDFRLADLTAPLEPLASPGSVDLVVSGYAIHHLPHARKRALYREIHDLLAPGGLFVNIEHVASPTPEIEALHDALFIDHLATHSGRPREKIAAGYHARPDKKDNILASVEDQLAWLRELGFTQVDCFLKWFELAVFGGVRREEQPGEQTSTIGARIVAEWERAGVVGSRPDITDSQADARIPRERAQTRERG
jgi:SAM-dependent methyltransferase